MARSIASRDDRQHDDGAERRAVGSVRQRGRHVELQIHLAALGAVSALDSCLAFQRLPERLGALRLPPTDHAPRVLGEHEPSGIRHGI